jgi:lysophospholipase L1-like esterase
MRTPHLLAVLLLATTIHAAPAPATLPASDAGLPGEGPIRDHAGYHKAWNTRRAEWAKRVEADQHAVVFLGDSITQGWGDDFKNKFPGMKLANRGIGGDTTRGMLIRLEEDVLRLNPAAVVLLMGTNDIEIGVPPEVIGRNFQAIIQSLKSKLPGVPIVLCRMFPSSETKKRPVDAIKKVNAIYDSIVRNDPQITVVDTWTLFANAEGNADSQFFPDLLHLNAAGYDRWAGGLRPIFATLGFIDNQPDNWQPEAGFVSLFNGKDLTGWGFRPTAPRKPSKNPPKPDAPVFVEINEPRNLDGKIESDDHRYRAINGRLVVTTPAEGRRIQAIWTQQEFPTDFILKLEFRATPNADSGVFLRQPQLQCRDFLLAGPYKQLKQFRQGDWNEMVVEVHGNTARCTCNGEVLEEAFKLPDTGPIGLEGDRGQMEYRHIQLKTTK